MTYDNNNIFARIIRKELPCRLVAQNDVAMAFDDIHPLAPVHVLLIPLSSYSNIVDFSQNASIAEQTGLWQLLPYVLKIKNIDNGFRMIANTGTWGGQEVPHLHWHILSGKPMGRMVS